MPRTPKTTTDAVKILYHRLCKGNPEMLEMLEEERANLDVAQKIYDLRTAAGLTQGQLAKLIGTKASAISRLESADYEGHSMSMLRRIAAALDRRLEIRFVHLHRRPKAA